jgi:CheY-like chemotaxis protein
VTDCLGTLEVLGSGPCLTPQTVHLPASHELKLRDADSQAQHDSLYKPLQALYFTADRPKVHAADCTMEPQSVDREAVSVLVVDDEPVVRQFLTRCLNKWGYPSSEAGNAAEALDMMITKPASVVLCDIKMPGQDGLWLSGRLRALWPNTAVVMVTAIDDLQSVRNSQEHGAVDYVTKPIAPERLLEALRRATSSGSNGHATPEDESPSMDQAGPQEQEWNREAEYTLESPVKCSACGERITTVNAVRLLRSHVNFTSTLPRRGRIVVCPHCLAAIPAELTNF